MNYKKLAIFLILNTFYMPALDGNEYDSKITVLYVEDDSVLFPANRLKCCLMISFQISLN